MRDDPPSVSELPPPRRQSAFVSLGVETLCLRLLAGLSLAIALGVVL
jgi:hypothetical protein